jgi:alpha-glucosidase
VRFIATVCLLGAVSALPLQHAPERLAISSPNGRMAFVLETGTRLTWSATTGGAAAIEPSALGLLVDGNDTGSGSVLQRTERYTIDETYPSRGVHATAVNRSNGARLTFRHALTRTSPVLDVRVADDGVAFRWMVDGSGRRVPDAAIGFRLPAGTVFWAHGLRDHYEGVHERRRIEDAAEGDWAAPPVTAKLPDGRGYLTITEADLRDYAGMALQADGKNGFYERLGHTHPASYPFTLRYGEDNARRLSAAAPVDGPIRTPWRVVIIGQTLNALVNSDLIPNLCPPPDSKLFPEGIRTGWLKPGRAVWRFLDGGEPTVAGIKEFSKLAADLGFEYQVVEGQWQKWTAEELRDVNEYSKARGVGILVWRHRNTLGDAAERRKLFASLQQAGVVGVKVDFLDHEAREVIDLYQAILRDAAEFHLMIDFHGANKPAGESRTWPNEMTREGIFGLEHRRMEAWATFNTTFPFTRMLAGHADYTPVVFGERRKETSWAHQIASAAILTSPLLVYGGHPASLLANPGADMIRSIPSVWDETLVLPPSEIGELAMFARRSGDRWFVAAMNGPRATTVKIDPSFLGSGAYRALLVRDDPDDAGAVKVETLDTRRDRSIEIAMRDAGGFIVRFTPNQ